MKNIQNINGNLFVNAEKFMNWTKGNLCGVELTNKELLKIGYSTLIVQDKTDKYEIYETYCILLEIELCDGKYSFVNQHKNESNMKNFQKGLNQLKL